MATKKDSSSVDKLYELKIQKIKEQKELADKMNDTLTKRGGLNESSKLTRKSLQAAIAVAKQPGDCFAYCVNLWVNILFLLGFFEYYKPSEDVQHVEEGKVLNQLARNISRTHAELEQINSEIEKSKHSPPTIAEIPLSSLSQWFDVYGRPAHADDADMLTTFSPSPKIYGGTAHHRSFKTQSSIMRKGRLTRWSTSRTWITCCFMIESLPLDVSHFVPFMYTTL